MRTKMLKILGLVAGATLLAAACSDDSSSSSDDTTTTIEAEVESETTTSESADSVAELNIVETAVADGRFETLVTAVTAAGLDETLSGDGPFTVFAPTDEAFAALPDGTLDELLADPEGALADVLTYHVVEGEVLAADVVELDGQSVATVNGAEVAISVDGENVMVNDATVVITDIETSNGVIHVIDAVLVP